MLANWSGSDRVCYLHADAASNYEALYRHQPGIKPVNCWAHARRKFYAIAGESPTRIFAHDAVEQIDVLFAYERAMPAGIWAAVLVAKNGCYRRGRGGF